MQEVPIIHLQWLPNDMELNDMELNDVELNDMEQSVPLPESMQEKLR